MPSVKVNLTDAEFGALTTLTKRGKVTKTQWVKDALAIYEKLRGLSEAEYHRILSELNSKIH